MSNSLKKLNDPIYFIWVIAFSFKITTSALENLLIEVMDLRQGLFGVPECTILTAFIFAGSATD